MFPYKMFRVSDSKEVHAMSTIFPGSVQLNGQNIQAHVKPLGQDVTPQRAKEFLEANKDGYDTIGFEKDGQNFLLLTRQKNDLAAGDQLKIDGERVNIDFVENEKTEFATGARVGAAIGGAIVGPMMMFLPTVITHSLIEDGATRHLVFGRTAKGLAQKALAKKWAIGLSVAGAIGGAALAIKAANQSVVVPNEKPTNSLMD